MNNLDIILIIALFIGFAVGYFKGLISQLTFGAGIIIGLLQAIFFYPSAAQKIAEATEWNDILCKVLAFTGIIIAVVLIFKIIGWLLSTLLKALFLGFIDKILGALFSMVIAALLVVGATNAISSLMPDVEMFSKTTQQQTVLYKHVQSTTFAVIGEIKEKKTESL